MDWQNFSIKIINIVLKYFTDLEEKYTRKQFNSVYFVASLLFMLVLYLITDVKGLEQTYTSSFVDIALNPEHGLNDIQKSETLLSSVGSFFPHPIWSALYGLLVLPAILKRTNDTFMHIAFIAPVALVYFFDFLRALFGFNWEFYLYDTMSIYNFVFIFLICLIPSKNNEEIED